jgi:phosphoribosylformylglycinamidine synthase
MAGELGVELDLDRCPDLVSLRPDAALFSESCGRFVITVREAEADRFEAFFEGLPCRRVGHVTGEPRIRARLGGRSILDVDLFELKAAWKATLAHAD